MPQVSPTNWAQKPTAKKPAPVAEVDKFVSGGKGTEKVRLNVQIDKDVRARFKAKCALAGRDIGDVMTELINDYLNK